MNQRISGILVIALLVSGVATYVVYRVVSLRASESTPQGSIVVRAARTLEIGTVLQPGDLTTGPWVGVPPAGMITKKETVLNRGVVQTIYEGEPVMESRLATAGAGGGLAATIPPGMRAVAVRVNDIVGVAGFVQPGMHVDVLIAGEVPEYPGREGAHVKTILQNIEVLSAGQNYQKEDAGKPVVVQVVNLLVTPEQAEVLSLASNEARIQLVLRNPLDTQTVKTTGTSVQRLYGDSTSEAAKPEAAPAPVRPVVTRAPRPKPVPVQPVAPPPPIQIEVLNGDKQSEVKFIQAAGPPQPVGAKQ